MTTLIPAYGRDYKSLKEVIADFEAGKDFKIADVSSRWNGSYTSIRDFGGVQVKLRYNKLTKFGFYTAKK